MPVKLIVQVEVPATYVLNVQEFEAKVTAYAQSMIDAAVAESKEEVVAKPKKPRVKKTKEPAPVKYPKFCNKCGNPIVPGTKFCNKCGNPIVALS